MLSWQVKMMISNGMFKKKKINKEKKERKKKKHGEHKTAFRPKSYRDIRETSP